MPARRADASDESRPVLAHPRRQVHPARFSRHAKEEEVLNRFIACCGLNCETCDARIATVTDDDALRQRTAALWSALNGVPITPEMIRCDGCRLNGAKTPFCDALCPIRRCVREKALDTCADCSQMDDCAVLGQITAANQPAADRLKKIRSDKIW